MSQDNKYIISEFYAFAPDKKILKELEDKGEDVILTGILQKANTLNRNGRVYPMNILKREADKYQQLVKENRALCELDHANNTVIALANVSHSVVEMWWEGDSLMGKIKIFDTPSGKIAKNLLKGGITLGISSRGVGSVKTNREGQDVVQDDFELICFDLVSTPSTPGAYMFKEGLEIKVGLVPLTNQNTKNTNTIEEKDRFSKLYSISKENFWKK